MAAAFVVTLGASSPAAAAHRLHSGTSANPASAGQPIAFGADLKPASKQTIQQTISGFETTTGRKLAFTRDYLLWDSPFPTDYEQWLTTRGTMPFVSVSPHTASNATISWASIGSAQPGDPVYTAMVSWADRIKTFGYPVYFTLNHEPEAASSQRYGSNTDFVAAWQNFHRVFDAEHVTNARWIWVMTAYAFTVNSSDRRWGPYWYPGDAYVDALGADAYTAYTCDNPTGIWHSLAYQIAGFTAFGAQHPSKPLWLPEWGVVEDPGLAGRKAQFINEAQALFKQPAYQQYVGVAYFDETRPGTTCYWDVSTSPSAQSAYNAMAQDAFYAGSAAFSLPDTTAPTVAITSPADGTTISGTTTIAATAADNVGVSAVAFSIDGTPLSTAVAPPYTATVDASTLAFGSHVLTAVATDAATNATTSSAVHVTVAAPPPDTTPPTVSITSPAEGATVHGPITVIANAADNVAVASVAFAVDGVALSTSNSAPYSTALDTTALTNGTHTVTAVATDTSGNPSTTAAVTITVAQPPPDTVPPTVAITSPAEGATVSGTVAVAATAADDVAVANVGFSVDGSPLSTSGVAPYSTALDTTTLTNGTHIVTAVATDTSGNPSTTAAVTITVAQPPPDATPPTVAITSPADGATVSGTVAVAATAADNVAVANVGFSVDGALRGTATAPPYTASISAGSLSAGSHTLVATATDTSGNIATSAPVHVTVPPPPPPPTQCAATPAGNTELSTNLSLENTQVGWTGQYNQTSQSTRIAVSGGSYDGGYALQIQPKANSTGVAGVNNVNPYWLPGPPGSGTVAGRSYIGSAQVRTSAAGIPVTVLLRETTSSGTVISSGSKTVTFADTSWHALAVTYKAKNAGDQIRYSLYATFPNTTTSLLGDCMSLQASA